MTSRAERTKFIAARAALVVARPATLVIASRFLGTEAANNFAQAIVAVGFGMVVSAFDSGRLFYEAALDTDGPRGVAFHRYVGRAWIVGCAGAAVVTAVLWASGAGPLLTAASLVYFATERVIDERQRYLLVDRRVREWSSMQLGRGMLQVTLACATLAAITLARSDTVAWVLLALAAANALMVPAGRGLRVGIRTMRSARTAAMVSARGVSAIRANAALWGSGLMAATLGFGDRLAIALWDGKDKASLVVMCSCMALQPVVVATFFFTPRRAAIVRREVPISVFASRDYWLPAGAGLAAGIAFAVASLAGFAADARASPTAIGAASIASLAVTLAGIVREVCHYRLPGRSLAAVDGGALAIFAGGAVLAWAIGLSVAAGFGWLGAVQAARAAILAALSNPKPRGSLSGGAA